MKKLLKQYFGFDDFRPMQEEIIDNVTKGNDSFVLMPTGGGKSLCYQLPALKFKGITLVISPLIALMKDQVDSLKECGVAAEYINSTLTGAEVLDILQRIRKGKVKILYIAPERFALPSFQDFLQSLKISLIAIDEAHCISEWGHDFRPDYRNLSVLKDVFPDVPMIALTATATHQVREDIVRQLRLAQAKKFVSSFDRENLKISVVEKKKAFPKLVDLLSNYKNESVIIYCFSRKETEKIVEDLKLNGFSARAYHAGLDNRTRKAAQNAFVRDRVNIIVATIAFGMGIDKSNVRLVVHYTYPKSLEGYYQEIGRAGRDGIESECVMFYSYADTRKHQFFIDQMRDDNLRELSQDKLSEVLNYGELTTCRKKYLLKYFGEDMKEDKCGACDVCLTKMEMFDATEVAQKIISAVARTESLFGRQYIVDVLRGKKTQKIKRNSHESLSVFGIVKNFSDSDLSHVINQITNLGYLAKSAGQYPILKLTKKAAQFLKEKKKLELVKPMTNVAVMVETESDQLNFNRELFEELRALRKQTADKLDLPPFAIFGDVSLCEMAYYFPMDDESFLKISGVGDKKLKQHGEAFLRAIKSFVKKNRIALADIPVKTDVKKIKEKTVRAASGRSSYYATTKEMIGKKISIDRIAKKQNLKPGTIVNHIEKMLDAEEELDLEYLKLPKSRYEKVKKAFEDLGDERLKPVFEHFDGKVSYDDLRLVRVLMWG